MTVGSGIGSFLGFGLEGSYGTPAAITRFIEFASETLEYSPNRKVGEGLAAGNLVQRNSTRQQVTSTVGGDIKTPMYFKGMGNLIGCLMGGGSGPYTLGPGGASLTIQKGVPQTDGTVVGYTYAGCVVTKGVFDFAADDFVQTTWSIDGRSLQVGGFSSPGYQPPNPIFAAGAGGIGVLVNGSLVEGIRKATMTIERPYDTSRFYLDGTGLKSKPVQNNFVKIGLSMDSDYLNDAEFCQQFGTDSTVAIGIGTASGTGFSVAANCMRWEKGSPMISGPGLIQPKLELVGLFDDVNNPCVITYGGGA